MLQDFPMYAYIPATDVARARQFYEGKLDITPRRRSPAVSCKGSGMRQRASSIPRRTPALRKRARPSGRSTTSSARLRR